LLNESRKEFYIYKNILIMKETILKWMNENTTTEEAATVAEIAAGVNGTPEAVWMILLQLHSEGQIVETPSDDANRMNATYHSKVEPEAE
jgi:hypothetical protein